MLVLSLMGCTPGSDTGTRPPDPNPNDPQFVRQGIHEVVQLYQTALRQSDMDRLQPLLRTANAPVASTALRQVQEVALQPDGCPALTTLNAEQFRDAITVLLQRFRVIAHHAQILDTDTSSSAPTVVLQEIISLEDTLSTGNAPPAQRTCVSNLRWRLTRQVAPELQDLTGVVVTSFLIDAVIREGPLFRVEMIGRVEAGALARIEVSEITDTFLIQEVILGEEGQQSSLQLQEDGVFRGVARLSNDALLGSIQVTARGSTGAEQVLQHTYQTRMPQALVAQRVGMAHADFHTLTEGRDGTIWAGAVGDEMHINDRGIFQIDSQDASVIQQVSPVIKGQILPVVDLVFDESDRLQAVALLRGEHGILANGVIVFTQPTENSSACQTVNVFDDHYPFRIRDVASGEDLPSPSVRAIAAWGDGIWLFASDGGVARVIDGVRSGHCGDPPTYPSFFSRQSGEADNRLLTNTVPALVESQDGALWFGTALGLMRWQHGQFTPIPFDPALSLVLGQLSQDQLNTLERFIGSVSAAIFAAQPIETVQIGNLSFLDFFGRALVKEDFIFSAVEDRQNRLWAGTVGGGIRRIEDVGGTFKDTLHITREDVSSMAPTTQSRILVNSQGKLVSNIIFALAAAPNGDIWAATDKGASRIQEQADGTIVITNYTALDGLTLPVRDVLVSDAGSVWLATDGGVHKLTSASGQLQGSVVQVDAQSGLESPVEGADVVLQNTPFRTITDDRGRFSLSPLPLSSTPYIVHVRSDHAMDGPFTQTFDTVTLDTSTEVTRDFVVVRRQPPIAIDPIPGRSYTFPAIPGSEIELGPEGPEFSSEIGLTLLPVDSLPPPEEMLTLVSAVELQPNDIVFTQPLTLTLPNPMPLRPNTRMVLFCLQTIGDGLSYSIQGLGQVNEDGLTSTATSFDALQAHCPILGFQTFSRLLQSR